MNSIRRLQSIFLLAALVFAVAAMTPGAAQAARVSSGIQALYGFAEGSGLTVQDLSGTGSPLDLTISDGGAVTWLLGGGLAVNSSAAISSGVAATKVITALQVSNEMTIEAWLVPANTIQS